MDPANFKKYDAHRVTCHMCEAVGTAAGETTGNTHGVKYWADK